MYKLKNVCLFILLICSSIFGLSGCYLLPKEEQVLAPPLVEPAKITYDLMEAKRRTIERKITGTASFVSVEQANVFFKHRGGRLKEITVKPGDKVKKGDILAELNTDGLESQIKQQKIMLQKAKLYYNKNKTEGADEYTLKDSQLNVELETIKLNDLLKELAAAKLLAPIGGNIVYVDDKINAGDYVDAFQNIIKIADPTKLQVEYNGDKVAEFKLGQKVDVKIKGEPYQGEVVTTPANLPPDVDENIKNIIRIKVDKLPKEAELGDFADISLTLEKKDNVIVLPKQVVHNYMGRRFVKVLENDIKKERDVEVGIETPIEVEIVKGIKEGEKIIVE